MSPTDSDRDPIQTQRPEPYGWRAFIKARLDRLVRQSRWALFVERLWRAVLPVLVVIGLFVGVSWLGLWLVLPAWAGPLGVLVFAGLALYAARDLLSLRWPSREDALGRVEKASGFEHRPLTALEDELSIGTGNPDSQAIWALHQRRTAETVAAIRSKAPDPQAFRRDPWALRVLAACLLVIGFSTAGGDRLGRLVSAFQNPFTTVEAPSRLDAWVTPPLYTSEPPIYLTGESAQLRDPGAPISVPEGAVLVVRSQGAPGLAVTFAGPDDQEPQLIAPEETAETADPELAKLLPVERRLKLETTGIVEVKNGEERLLSYVFAVRPDDAPEIRLTDDPEEQLSGALKFSYLVKDDYGVVAAEARIVPLPNPDHGRRVPRPLVEAPQFPLSLPPRAGTAKTAETIRDLTSHPWAGSEVDLLLTARDQAGQEGVSPAYRITLPQRRFSKPLARAVAEQRRNLALDAQNQDQVIIAFDALMLAPHHFNFKPRNYLGMRFAYGELIQAQTDEELKDLLPLLWDLALSIEDGDLSAAERKLRDAQEALRKALEEGASDEEIAKLTQQLREALNEYMQALAEQMRQNPQAMQPFDGNQQTLNQQDLSDMLDRIEELARTGSRDAARELLAQMQQMLENLQAGRPQMMPNGMSSEMMEMLNQLGEMIQKQQQLMDETHKYNQDQQQRGQQQQQQQGQGQQMTQEQLEQMLEQLQQGQGDLAQQLQELMDQLNQNGMGQNQALGEAGDSMGDAQQSLGEGQGQQALGQQGNALDALRRGAQGLTEQMMGQGEGAGAPQGPSPLDEDPLGRPRRTEGPDFNNRVQIPDEIDVQRARRILEELRRRFSDPSRPKLELDYLERLLKRY
ncbi:TIGR02302 family protein [Roseibium sediminicola]|uniref:TIGR02302 family protein n=1 Tax=Roseibium sediminicola TaxID=2933272 RepID=A0ABT0GYC4_9HYPH|nr:TIGR02302 family protein [Roseibium sp. CAU 1639]MCK7614432.1 TIGR02302 family protein [Roseibium sp. CAU 1639]